MILHQRLYLRVKEGAKDGDCSSKGIYRLDRRMEDYDGRDNDWNPLHRVANAKCQRRDFIQWHVWNLVVQVVENALRCYPPTKYQYFVSEPQDIDNRWNNINNVKLMYESNPKYDIL